MPFPLRFRRRCTRRPLAILAGCALLAAPVRAQGVAGASASDGDGGVDPAIAAAAAGPGAPAPGRAPFGDRVILAARRHLGVPYRWGGATPDAFDCSGFVRWVYREAGVALPRTAREQAGIGDAPYPGDLQPGDLLFFWGGRGAQHVAIYAGGGSIIHASIRHRRVRVDRMQGHGFQRNWFGQRLIAVRRVRPMAEGVASTTPGARQTIFPGGPR